MKKLMPLGLMLCFGVVNGASKLSGIPIMNKSGFNTIIGVSKGAEYMGAYSPAFLQIHEQNKMMYLPENTDSLSASSVGVASKENLEGSESLVVTPELKKQFLAGEKYIVVDKSGKRFVLKIIDAKPQAEQKKEAGKKPEQKK